MFSVDHTMELQNLSFDKHGAVIDQASAFAPVSFDLIESLVSQYRHQKQLIENVASVMAGSGYDAVLEYFLAGVPDETAVRVRAAGNLFDEASAIAALDADYWNRALDLTSIRELMPSNRVAEWDEQIRSRTCLPFEENAVRNTLAGLISSSAQFLAERVDAVFHALSPEHVTNSPSGFSKRMILLHARYKSCGSINTEVTRFISDLRFVISVLMGRDAPVSAATGKSMEYANRHHGEWHLLDGGALKVRFHLAGTAHLEVHPDIAWSLNQMLNTLYPAAIPAKFRQRFQRKALQREWPLIERTLSFGALGILAKVTTNSLRKGEYWFPVDAAKSPHWPEVEAAIEALGGAKLYPAAYAFEYADVLDVIGHVVATGRIPDHKSHQFYGSPAVIAETAIAMASIKPTDEICEPSAGQAGLAKYLPVERTTCVEVSPLNCEILRKHGLKTIQADFLQWALTAPQFDCLVMNPPFSAGRAQAHVESAATLVRPKGRVVAVLPASMRGKDLLPGWEFEWSGVFSDVFKGTSVSVAIFKATRIVH